MKNLVLVLSFFLTALFLSSFVLSSSSGKDLKDYRLATSQEIETFIAKGWLDADYEEAPTCRWTDDTDPTDDMECSGTCRVWVREDGEKAALGCTVDGETDFCCVRDI